MLVASVSQSESTAILELFSLPVANGNLGPTSLIKVATLGLPFVDDLCRIARVDFNTLFVKNLVIRDRRLLYKTSIDATPFISTNSDNIIFVHLNVGSSYGYDDISFIVHSSTLLRYTHPSHSHGHGPDLVPWEFWGPAVTRWYDGGIPVGRGPVTCGHRCLLRIDLGAWEVWDFNPYRVRRLEKGFVVENETSLLTVETEPSCTKSSGFRTGIISSLPFVKLVAKKWRYTYMALYEHKVIGERVSNCFNFSIFLTLVQ
jgi:hypothetical protein